MSLTRAIFNTSMGQFKVDLWVKRMPYTTSNFIDLAKSGFYDGLHFHRIIKNFVVQFGCPNTRISSLEGFERAGAGRPPPSSKFQLPSGEFAERDSLGNIQDELVSRDRNSKFTLAMANPGRKNAGGSQFFINLADNDYLNWFNDATPSFHPVFGEVVEGMEVLESIENTPAARDGTPLELVEVKSVAIEVE